MFLTITIDTSQKKNKKVRMNQNKVNASKGWKRSINSKKRSLVQKIRVWRRSMKGAGIYKFGDHAAVL
jgi:hypothetical protein